MSRSIRCYGGLLGLLVSVLGTNLACGQIFADFTTSMGSFTCQLDQTNAPRAVANFIGLAGGQRAWLDLNTGHARTNAFYNGLTFHRVIADFMIQGGSPNGTGSDGPGYAFRDEFSPSLRFTNFGVLAMANSGTNSNGAQFFVTVAPTTWLNDVHTIFGKVTSGSNVVYAISRVATDSNNNKPLTNVVIQQVAIRRVGTAAQNFDLNAQALPVVTNLPIRTARFSNQLALTISNRLYADNRIFSATNFSVWAPAKLGIEITGPNTNSWRVAIDQPKGFYRFAQVQYSHSTFAPKDLFGRKLTLTFTSGYSGSVTNNFDLVGTGTYSSVYGSGSIYAYLWTQEPYRGQLVVGYTGLPVTSVQLDFNTAISGSFKGGAYPNYPSSAGAFGVTGTFSF